MSIPFVELAGPSHNLQLFGVKLLGINAHNGHKLIITVVFFVLLYIISSLLRWFARIAGGRRNQMAAFWTRQGISLLTFIFGALGFMSIWFDNPTRLATGIGLASAGLAFALQKVITSFAGYFVILRGNTFNVGDRITMGGVRGDVIALNFIQTVIMEMGQPPSVQDADPGMWVQSRQYSGRIVTVTNSKIFDEPVYNYTRDFPFLWEEMHIPITYKDSRETVERILLECAAKETVNIEELAHPVLKTLEERFFIEAAELKPRVYVRLTDNWVEMTVRFLVKDHDIRGLKDRLSRDVINRLDGVGIGIASATYDIVGMPPIRVQLNNTEQVTEPK
jgi:small-conductance mechanosensitive channel